MQKVVDLMKKYTNFNHQSRFIDIGSGLGKPNLHVAVDPGVEFRCSIEVQDVRWKLSIVNWHYILKEEMMLQSRIGEAL